MPLKTLQSRLQRESNNTRLFVYAISHANPLKLVTEVTEEDDIGITSHMESACIVDNFVSIYFLVDNKLGVEMVFLDLLKAFLMENRRFFLVKMQVLSFSPALRSWVAAFEQKMKEYVQCKAEQS